MGFLTDTLGPRRAGLLGIGLTFVPLAVGWLASASYGTLLVVALLRHPRRELRGRLPLASRWYPPRHQGLVMGIAGAGNSGTVLAALAMPRLAAAYGWQTAIGLALLPMAGAALVFFVCAKGSPSQPQPPPRRRAEYAAIHSITFGGFAGLASLLAIFFYDQYGVDKVAAGDLTALCVFAGSFMRPVGGWLADRHGGIRLLQILYAMVAVLVADVATLPALPVAVGFFVVALALLGAGNGALFQLVPLRFRRDVGLINGLVGAAGGRGGFFLPSILGYLRDTTGTWTTGFAVMAAVCLWGMSLMVAVKGAWQLTWATKDVGVAREPAAR